MSDSSKPWGPLGMKILSNICGLSISTLLIAGCALPLPLQVASWALDGLSYVMTEKSMTDHGLSVVAQQDCAVWRGVTEGELCREWQDGGGTLVANKPVVGGSKAPIGFAPLLRSAARPPEPNIDDGQPHSDDMMNLVTAVRPAQAPVSLPNVIEPDRTLAVPITKPPVRNRIAMNVAPKASKRLIQHAMSRSMTRVAERTEPVTGVYFVIGSFRKFANARMLASRHGTLVPAVLAAKLDGAPIYRVVVGPAVAGGEKSLHRRIAKMGLRDTWAIRVQPGDWTIARSVIEQAARVIPYSQLAQSRY